MSPAAAAVLSSGLFAAGESPALDDPDAWRSLADATNPMLAQMFEAMPHGGFFGTPEDAELDAEVRRFVAAHLPGVSS